MKLDATQIALVRIAEKRNQAVNRRTNLQRGEENVANWAYEAGTVAGLQAALDLLREAGLPVASAEYLATGGGETEADGSQAEPAGRVQ